MNNKIILRNCYGEILSPNAQRELIHPKYGIINENNRIIPNWTLPNDTIDENGFDKHNIESNGNYVIELLLSKGTMLCRYGYETGKFTAYLGTPYEQLGLPWKKETQPYNEYEVIADGYKVQCLVIKGKVGAMFNSPGGAVQFMHYHSITEEVELYKVLRRLDYEEWNKKQMP